SLVVAFVVAAAALGGVVLVRGRVLDAGTYTSALVAADAYERTYTEVLADPELAGLAEQLGYRRVRLETGYAQPEALAMYRRLGFTEIDSFGPYEGATAFELDLAAEARTPRH
ncbi:MAG: hypothetical protein ABWY68_04850, partial [Cryobacterium sp.]